jgi:class 3 adenylate cyclase
MGHQVLAPNVRISIRNVTLVFTDLTSSTAMYEELGDAAAYALVRDHFAVLRRQIEAHNGVLVKTIGDAVMAAFHEPGAAVTCCIELMRAYNVWSAGKNLNVRPQLKVGVHTGPALMVHTDANGLDYFGGSVNLAARAQGAASPGELVITHACHGHPGVLAALQTHGLEPSAHEVSMKGLSTSTLLYRVMVTPDV